jgi:hypothetical protein
VEGRAGQAVKPRDNQRVALAHVLQAGGQPWALAGCAALLLVELFVRRPRP